MLNEGSDVYSFGVLLMEIITGRSPVDYSRPPAEVNLDQCINNRKRQHIYCYTTTKLFKCNMIFIIFDTNGQISDELG